MTDAETLPRTVETIEELNCLIPGSVILDVDGDPWKKKPDGLWLGFRNEMEESGTLFWGHAEIRPTILHVPGVSRSTHEADIMASAIEYAEDQAMAGAYFPEWQRCADLLRAMCAHRGIQVGV